MYSSLKGLLSYNNKPLVKVMAKGAKISKNIPKQGLLKAYYCKKVDLVDLSTYGGKIKFEFWLSRQCWAGRQNSNFIFPP